MKLVAWLTLCLIWGTTWLFIKIGLEEIPPFGFALSRFLISLAVVAVLIRVRSIPLPKGRAQWSLLAFTGVLQFSVNYSLVFWSELHITSGLAAVLQATIPVFGLFLAAVYLPEEKFSLVKVLAIVLGVAGVGVIFIEQLRLESLMSFIGSVAIVIGAFAAAQSSILTKAKGGDIHPASILFGQMLFGVIPIFVISAFFEGYGFVSGIGTVGIVSLLYLSVFGTVVTFWVYYWLLSRVESAKAMTIALVTPLVAVVCGNIFLGEKLRIETALGAVMILASVGLIIFRKSSNMLQEEAEISS